MLVAGSIALELEPAQGLLTEPKLVCLAGKQSVNMLYKLQLDR